MEVNLQTEYWGQVSYREAWERQTALFDEIISALLTPSDSLK